MILGKDGPQMSFLAIKETERRSKTLRFGGCPIAYMGTTKSNLCIL